MKAVPEGQNDSRLAQCNQDLIIWPDVRAGYLKQFLNDVGLCVNNGMGVCGVSWQEIHAWQEQCGIELSPWEAKAIKTASHAYAYQAGISNKKDCPPPTRVFESDATAVASALKRTLRQR